MKEEKEKGTWKSVRGLFNTIHLWLGVGSGLIIFLVCLSGTVYTFSSEIQKRTDSDLYNVEIAGDSKRLPAAQLISNLLDSVKGGVVQSIVIPSDASGSYQITVGKAEEKKKPEQDKKENNDRTEAKGKKEGAQKPPAGRARGTTYFVNPYTGAILGTNETSTSAFFMFMFRLHRWLLLDMEIGRPIVGVATLIFVVMIISGWIIWFPKKIKNWRQGLRIKTSANWKRVNHDLHSALGLYASLFLFVMALTGLTWSFEWYKKGFVNMFSATEKKAEAPQFKSEYTSVSEKATVEALLSDVETALPYAGDTRMTLPSDSSGVVNVSKTRNAFFATSVGDKIMLDQYTGSVLNRDLFSNKPFGDQVVASIKAIHVGSFNGTFSKIIYFIACLIGTSLPVTGVIIWINKLRKKKDKDKSPKKARRAQEISVAKTEASFRSVPYVKPKS
jgi:uncharacterized iron-regulated membrane protein